jgi:hypothetical protein
MCGDMECNTVKEKREKYVCGDSDDYTRVNVWAYNFALYVSILNFL